MKKFYFAFLFIICSTIAFSHSIKRDFSFTIIFAGKFENDIVSLKINKKDILHKYTVDNSDVVKRGHLSLTQYERDLKISYNGKYITKPAVTVNHTLDIDITVNGKAEKITVDLRKGNILLVDYILKENTKSKKVTIEQLEEPYIVI